MHGPFIPARAAAALRIWLLMEGGRADRMLCKAQWTPAPHSGIPHGYSPSESLLPTFHFPWFVMLILQRFAQCHKEKEHRILHK